MNILSYENFIYEGKRADAISMLCDYYEGDKQAAINDIDNIYNKLTNEFESKQLANKYLYNVVNFIMNDNRTSNDIENKELDVVEEIASHFKKYIAWEPRMKLQGKQLSTEQIDKMTISDFINYLDVFFFTQKNDSWKLKNTKQKNIETTGAYELIHVANWDIAKQYNTGKLTWCVVLSETALREHTKKGETLFFAFKNGYNTLKSYPTDKAKYGRENKFDEFATSALAIKVHADNTITVTCRYNHTAHCNDNVYGDHTIPVLRRLDININQLLNNNTK